MQENLVIVESPAKAKKIEEFLGKDYKVMSSYGHIRDLKKKELSINEQTMEPDYEIPDEKKKLVTELKATAKKAKKIWLASDEDREGEAISWHLCEVLGLDEEKTYRLPRNYKTGYLGCYSAPTPLGHELSECPTGSPCSRPTGGFQAFSSTLAQGETCSLCRSRTERSRQTHRRT